MTTRPPAPPPSPSPVTAPELAALEHAVALAARGAGTALPNPVVGCVLIGPDGGTVGEGFHLAAGGPHAEVVALQAAGPHANGATAVVTLEPCNHTGRTGPCSEALIEAGVSRVVTAVRDDTDAASGGLDRLRQAGIEVVDLSDTPESGPAREVNRVWLTATRLSRPFVTFKSGMTIDGRVAAADRTSKWITSPESRADVHRLRAEVDTMMVGIGTVLADDPQLTARDADGALAGRQPTRVVVDSQNRTPSTARVLDSASDTVIATAAEFGGPEGRVDLPGLLDALYARGQRHVLLEGGPRLAAAMFDAALVDEVLLYIAPLLLGAGTPMVDGSEIGTLADAHRFDLIDVNRFGPDLRVRFRPRGTGR